MKLKDAMLDKHSDRVNAILATTEDDEEFLLNFFKLLEYVQPKLQRTEVKHEAEEDLTLKVEYVTSQADKEKPE